MEASWVGRNFVVESWSRRILQWKFKCFAWYRSNWRKANLCLCQQAKFFLGGSPIPARCCRSWLTNFPVFSYCSSHCYCFNHVYFIGNQDCFLLVFRKLIIWNLSRAVTASPSELPTNSRHGSPTVASRTLWYPFVFIDHSYFISFFFVEAHEY